MDSAVATKKKPTSVYLDDGLKTEAIKLAALEKRSLNNLIEVLLQKAVDEATCDGRLGVKS